MLARVAPRAPASSCPNANAALAGDTVTLPAFSVLQTALSRSAPKDRCASARPCADKDPRLTWRAAPLSRVTTCPLGAAVCLGVLWPQAVSRSARPVKAVIRERVIPTLTHPDAQRFAPPRFRVPCPIPAGHRSKPIFGVLRSSGTPVTDNPTRAHETAALKPAAASDGSAAQGRRSLSAKRLQPLIAESPRHERDTKARHRYANPARLVRAERTDADGQDTQAEPGSVIDVPAAQMKYQDGLWRSGDIPRA